MSSSKQDWNDSHEQSSTSSENRRDKIVSTLSKLLTERVFDIWFDGGRSIVVHRQSVEVLATNEFLLNRIKKTYIEQIREAVEEVCGPHFSVSCRVNESSSEPDSVEASTVTPVNPVRLVQTDPPQIFEARLKAPPQKASKKGTESFYFGDNNRLTKVSINHMFERFGQVSPLLLYGPAGCGKTHLLESLTYDARRKHNFRRCVSLSAEQFTSQFVQAVRGTGLPVFRRKYRDLDLLAIDDVQFFAGKKATLAEFQYTLDNLIRNGKQIILSSDRPPVDLNPLGQEVMAKIYGGMACALAYPDAEGTVSNRQGTLSPKRIRDCR